MTNPRQQEKPAGQNIGQQNKQPNNGASPQRKPGDVDKSRPEGKDGKARDDRQSSDARQNRE